MADKKVTQLTSLTNSASEDLLLIIDDPTGTPVSKQISLLNLFGNLTANVTTTGVLSAANTTVNGVLTNTGDTIRISTTKTPSSASDTGNTGQIAWDADYIYVCTATNTWKRVAISTW